jgi:hypothetical protein
MVGDSNSIRTCNVIKERGKRCQLIGKGAEDAFKGSSPSPLQQQNTSEFFKSTSSCIGSNSATALNIGHHIPEFAPLSEIQSTLAAIRSTILNQLSAKGNYPSSPVIVWSTLASHVSRFALTDEDGKKFPYLLMLQSNSYREVLQNEEVKRTFSNIPGVVYLDLFSPTLALGEIAHNVGDPVHFSSEAYYFGHKFIMESLMIAEDCYKMRDCSGNSSSSDPSLISTHHTKWIEKDRLGPFNDKVKIPFPGKIDYEAYATTFCPPARPGWETPSLPPPPPPSPLTPHSVPPPRHEERGREALRSNVIQKKSQYQSHHLRNKVSGK